MFERCSINAKGMNLLILKPFGVYTFLPVSSKLTFRNDFPGCFVQPSREKETKWYMADW